MSVTVIGNEGDPFIILYANVRMFPPHDPVTMLKEFQKAMCFWQGEKGHHLYAGGFHPEGGSAYALFMKKGAT